MVLPYYNLYLNGDDRTMWLDLFCDEVGFTPMLDSEDGRNTFARFVWANIPCCERDRIENIYNSQSDSDVSDTSSEGTRVRPSMLSETSDDEP